MPTQFTLQEFISTLQFKKDLFLLLNTNTKRTICEWTTILSLVKTTINNGLLYNHYYIAEEILFLFFNSLRSPNGFSNVESCHHLLPIIPTEKAQENYIDCQSKKMDFYMVLGELLYDLQKKPLISKPFHDFLIEKHQICKNKFVEHSNRLCNYNANGAVCQFLKQLI
jgi:hypothetical protein